MDEESKIGLFKEIKEFSNELKKNHDKRIELYGHIDDAYLMRQTTFEKNLAAVGEEVALTKSPDERIAVQSVVRILTKTVPKVNMARARNLVAEQDFADMIEAGANALLSSSDRVNQRPLHYEAVLSAVLYDSITIQITCTKDDLDRLERDEEDRKSRDMEPIPQARKERVKRFVKEAPYVMNLLRATDTFPWHDYYGLKGVLSVSKVKVNDLLGMYGVKAYEILEKDIKASQLLKPKEVWNYTDDLYRCVWVDGKLLMLEEHELPFLPFVSNIIEGSYMFEKIEDQYAPFLMGVIRSGLDRRKTEAYTAKYTNIRALGLNPQVVHKRGPNNEAPGAPQRVGLTMVYDLPYGADMYPLLNRGITDPSVDQGLAMAEAKTEQLTIYKTVVGESQSETYSQTALLSQLARIPLETVKNMTGRVIADALEIAFRWIKHNKENVTAYDYNQGAIADIVVEEIPEYFNLDCNLDVALPQDELQQANTASILVQAGIASTEWIQENVLKVESPKDMFKQIIRERYTLARIDEAIFEKIERRKAEFQKKLAEEMQPPVDPNAVPPEAQGAAPPPEAGGVLTPGTTMGLAPGAMPGIPPEMLAGGAQGPREEAE